MLFQTLNNNLKEAIKTQNEPVKNYIRNVKSRITEYQVANRLDKDVEPEDELVLKVIKSYTKQLNRAVQLLSKGKPATSLIEEYKKEIDYFSELTKPYA